MTVSASYLSLPDPAAMAADLAERLPEFGHVAWVLETGSTNADLLAQVRAGAHSNTPMPWMLGTHLQTSGRGRAGRPWQNESGACLMLSCAFHVRMAGQQLPALSPMAGLAACEALRTLVGDAVATKILVKWPNDVQFGPKKLGGILVETVRAPASDGYIVVIGMGLNLSNAVPLSKSLGREVADWTQLSDRTDVCPQMLATTLAQHWLEMTRYAESNGFTGLSDRYRAVDALAGTTINVVDRGQVILTGNVAGYDEHGRLEIQTESGVVPVSVGDVSVRPG